MKDQFKRIQLKKYTLTTLLACSIFTACADTPDAAVPKRNNNNDDGRQTATPPASTGTNKIKALKFTGTHDHPLKSSCNLYLALEEEDHDHGGHDHKAGEHSVLMKLDFKTMDGHTPSATEGLFRQYNSDNETYLGEDEVSADTSLVSVGMTLKDGTEGDLNSLPQYIRNKSLAQYIRVHYKQNSDAHDFSELLEEALETTDTSTIDFSKFNIIDEVSLGLAHGDHYHFDDCKKYTAVSIVEIEFDMDGNDDHDHGDHDGHGHHNHLPDFRFKN